MLISEEERFMTFVITEPNSGCWIHMGALDSHGYAGFRRSPYSGNKWQRAHRASYEMFVGEIPKNLGLDHLCRVRCCVNPAHLEPVTSKENNRRGVRAANQRAITHCPKGHEYSGENLYVGKEGKRYCKKCSRNSTRRWRARNG